MRRLARQSAGLITLPAGRRQVCRRTGPVLDSTPGSRHLAFAAPRRVLLVPVPSMNPGLKFRAALKAEIPLQIAGVINAYAALLAERAGFHALYLSGAGVANHSF